MLIRHTPISLAESRSQPPNIPLEELPKVPQVLINGRLVTSTGHAHSSNTPRRTERLPTQRASTECPPYRSSRSSCCTGCHRRRGRNSDTWTADTTSRHEGSEKWGALGEFVGVVGSVAVDREEL